VNLQGEINMANITGTPGNDFVHMTGDGLPLPFGYTDFPTATNAADTIDTGFGDDIIRSYGGVDNITAGDGHDYIDAGAAGDTVNAGIGNDTIFGGQGIDNLIGDVGADSFRYHFASDISGLAETIDGGADEDTIDFQATGISGTINLSLATITSVENLLLTGNTTLLLNAAQFGAFSFIGGTFGIERLVLSGPGTADFTGVTLSNIDEIRGSSGADVVILTGVAQGQTVNGLGGIDSLTGGSGNDLINGGNGGDTLDGGLGNDILIGGNGADNSNGNSGNDSFRFELASEVSGLAETIDGGADIDTIQPGAGECRYRQRFDYGQQR
jgi:Ca2+-binding RTX toxin-like protein